MRARRSTGRRAAAASASSVIRPAVAVDPRNGDVFVVEGGGHRVQRSAWTATSSPRSSRRRPERGLRRPDASGAPRDGGRRGRRRARSPTPATTACSGSTRRPATWSVVRRLRPANRRGGACRTGESRSTELGADAALDPEGAAGRPADPSIDGAGTRVASLSRPRPSRRCRLRRSRRRAGRRPSVIASSPSGLAGGSSLPSPGNRDRGPFSRGRWHGDRPSGRLLVATADGNRCVSTRHVRRPRAELQSERRLRRSKMSSVRLRRRAGQLFEPVLRRSSGEEARAVRCKARQSLAAPVIFAPGARSEPARRRPRRAARPLLADRRTGGSDAGIARH